MNIKKHCFLIFFLFIVFVFQACSSLEMQPLIKATDQGQLEEVNMLIAQGADVNACDINGSTPLMAAAVQSDQKIVKTLIENGADVYAETKMGTAHGAALHYGYTYIAQYINDARKKLRAGQ